MDDLISRRAVLALPRNKTRNMRGEIVDETINVACIEQLPSAQPERRTGKWIIGRYRLTCGQCRFTYPNKLMDEMGVVNYCPHCGAEMEKSK